MDMLPTNVKSKAEESTPKETKRTFFSSFSPNPVTKKKKNSQMQIHTAAIRTG